MTGEQTDDSTGETEDVAMREMVRDAFLTGGVSLDRMIERFFETEDAK